jgi:hypothetical protein
MFSGLVCAIFLQAHNGIAFPFKFAIRIIFGHTWSKRS